MRLRSAVVRVGAFRRASKQVGEEEHPSRGWAELEGLEGWRGMVGIV